MPGGTIRMDDDDYLTLKQYINTACKLYYKVHGLHCKYDCKLKSFVALNTTR